MPLLKTEYLHRDTGAPPPAAPNSEVFAADAQVLPSTANAKDGTIDVVWYSGAFVPRIDRSTGEPYMLKLSMDGCRFDRLNNGAPVFDTHFTGDDFKSLVAGKVGTRAQVGVVRRAWPNGDKGWPRCSSTWVIRTQPRCSGRPAPASSRTSASAPLFISARKPTCRPRACRREAAVPEQSGNRHVHGH
jgi:hypothetical protein